MAGVKGKSGTSENSLKNLTNIADNVTSEDCKRNGQKGGKASGAARRQRKEMRDIVLDIFEIGVKRGKVKEEFDSLEETKGQNLTVMQALILSQVKKALSGDTRALEFLRDTAGMKPADKQEITATVGTSALQSILKQLDENESDENKEQEESTCN